MNDLKTYLDTAIATYGKGLKAKASRYFTMKEPVIPVGNHFHDNKGRRFEITIAEDGLRGKILRIS